LLFGHAASLPLADSVNNAPRKGKPTPIRTYDFYNPIYREWKKLGKYEEYKRYWDA
jgi:hypothetical protein